MNWGVGFPLLLAAFFVVGEWISPKGGMLYVGAVFWVGVALGYHMRDSQP